MEQTDPLVEFTLLDTETGETETTTSWCRYSAIEHNFSCDCNRRLCFDLPDPEDDGICEGCKRFLIIKASDGGNLLEVNEGYPRELLAKYGIV